MAHEIKSLRKVATIRQSSNHYNSEVILGTTPDGRRYFYHITSEELKTVRKVYTDDFNAFIAPTLNGLDEAACRVNTKLLWAILIEQGYEAVLKGTFKKPFIDAYDYRIKCNDYGYYIEDGRNFYKPLNFNDYGNEYPDIESVIKFLKMSKDRPITVIDPSSTIVLKTGEKLVRRKVDENEYVKPISSTLEVGLAASPSAPKYEVVKEVKVVPKGKTIDEILTAFVEIHTSLQVARPRYTYTEMCDLLKEKVYPMIDEAARLGSYDPKDAQPLKVRIGTAMGKTLNPHTMLAEVNLAFHRPRVKAPASRFIGLMFNEDWEFCKADGDTVTYSYRVNNVLIPKTKQWWQILWRQLLTKNRNLMAQFMKTAEGEYQHTLGKCVQISSKAHSFVEFDKRVLDNPTNRENFIECVEDWASFYGIPYLWLTMYDPTLQVGTKVKVMYPDLNKWYVGRVSSTKYGIEVTYTDGTVSKVKNSNTVKILSQNSVKFSD